MTSDAESTENDADPRAGAGCPLVAESGPRRARQLESWTLVDDGSEEAVTVPHTWNADEIGGEAEYDRDEKVYRTTVESHDGDGRQLLHFEGINETATVTVDGERVGTHEGGYTAFTFDVTDSLADDSPSTVEVIVDNTENKTVPPLSGDFTFFGGIYRPVWLVAVDDVRMDGTEYGSSGVRVDTPSLSAESATVRARTAVVNDRSTAVSADVTHRVVDDGETVAEFGATVPVGPGGRRSIEARSDAIEDPRRWDLDDPHCYTVETTVAVDGETTDRVDSPLGIREFDVDDEGRIVLNGEAVRLQGLNRHQDRPGVGTALSDEAHREDFEAIADTGANFLRLAHYPQSETILRAADAHGLVLWEEIPVVSQVGSSAEHDETARRMVREMVHQHYNHPSVGIWGFMNEVLIGHDYEFSEWTSQEDMVHRARELGTELDALLREIDPNRLTAMACHWSWSYEEHGLAEIPDVLGWNLYYGWYYGEFDYLTGAIFEKIRARQDQATIISEYGAGGDVRLHTSEPENWDFTEEYLEIFYEHYVAAFDEFGDRVGSAQWNAFDFASDARDDTIPDVNQKGLLTYDREHKHVYHLYRAWLSDEPVVRIATRNWDRRSTASASDDGTHPITVYTNLPVVELFVDGESLGTERTGDGYAARWDVPLAVGANEIRARALDADDGAPGIAAGDVDGEAVEDRTDVELVSAAVEPSGRFPEGGLSVDVGSHREIVTDEELWVPDRAADAEANGWGPVGGEHVETQARIFETDLDPLYQHALEGIEAYRIDVPPGSYDLEIAVCDLDNEAAGERVFDVSANGRTLAADFDPVAEAGERTPATVTAVVDVEADESLVVEFEAETGKTLLNALRVEEA
mgnify:FL=1